MSDSLWLAPCALLLASGCYVSNPREHLESGTRLRAITYAPASGEPIFGGWYDTELEQECAFRRNADGRLRCEPHAELTLTIGYLDEGCTEPVYEVADPACAASYVIPRDIGGRGPSCGPVEITALHRVGERLEVTRVFRRTSDGCEARDAMPVVHRLTPVDPSAFVAADEEEGMGAWLARDRLVADDGATQPMRLRDTRRGALCELAGDPWGSVERAPCTPDSFSLIVRGGASCDATWAIDLSCEPDLELVTRENEDECGRITSIEVFRGTPVPESELTSGAECALGFPLTEAVTLEPADDAVPWLTRAVHGSGRLRRMVWEHGELEAASLPYDAELETTCIPAMTAGGELRCIPRVWSTDLGEDRVFVDDACTQLGIGSVRPSCLPSWVLSRASTCAPAFGSPAPAVDAAYRIGAPAPRGFHLDESGACVPTDAVVYALEPVPLTAFALLERRME